MRKAFVVGHPIVHSRSPLIHKYWLDTHGIKGSYERVDIHPTAFEGFIKQIADVGWAGGNVTIPHKEAAFRLVDGLTERAKKIGAVNTLVVSDNGRLFGDNTDAPGFVSHIENVMGPKWLGRLGKTAVILGAGGAARAIIVGLCAQGFGRVIVANRTVDRARSLIAIDPNRIEVIDWDDLSIALDEADLLVNTTSLGMSGQPPLVIELDALPNTAAVADIVYKPLETSLLANARARGLTTVDGLGMLLHQAVPGFEAWFGVRPAVTAELRNLIVADLMQ